MTATEWSKTYRQTRDAMHDAACDIAEAIERGMTPGNELIIRFTVAKAAHNAVVNTKVEHGS